MKTKQRILFETFLNCVIVNLKAAKMNEQKEYVVNTLTYKVCFDCHFLWITCNSCQKVA